MSEVIKIINLKKTFSILLLTYYSFGILFLPMGDFSVLKDLPKMYEHCKENEDKDMTSLDFVTDHLLNTDGLFDSHDNGDKQKPHSPVHTHHQTQLVVFQPFISFDFKDKSFRFFEPTLYSVYFNSFVKSGYLSTVFRPPIIA